MLCVQEKKRNLKIIYLIILSKNILANFHVHLKNVQ